MSVKRKDSKGRNLRNGESQRKDGRYVYKYIGLDGKDKFVYSWRLESTDKIPRGKRDDIALREKEKQIRYDLENGINSSGGDITVAELIKKYISQKKTIKATTEQEYLSYANTLNKKDISRKKICNIKQNDAKVFLAMLKEQDGMAYGTIVNIKKLLEPAFDLAMSDGSIQYNPFNFNLNTIIKNDTKKRIPLTKSQEIKMLDFLEKHNILQKYRDPIYLLLHTGLRISEFAGLTFNDIDLKNKTITVSHQLSKMSGVGYIVHDPKSNAGFRKIPISDQTCCCIQRIINNRRIPKIEPVVNNLSGFLFLNKYEKPTHKQNWDDIFAQVQRKYNETYPGDNLKITPHICRHTYCSNMAMGGMKPKTLQYIMGHSSIAITLDVYTHLQYESVEEEFAQVIGNIEDQN